MDNFAYTVLLHYFPLLTNINMSLKVMAIPDWVLSHISGENLDFQDGGVYTPKPKKCTPTPLPEPRVLLQIHFPRISARSVLKGAVAFMHHKCQKINLGQQNLFPPWKVGRLSFPALQRGEHTAELGCRARARPAAPGSLGSDGISLLICFSGFQLGFS